MNDMEKVYSIQRSNDISSFFLKSNDIPITAVARTQKTSTAGMVPSMLIKLDVF